MAESKNTVEEIRKKAVEAGMAKQNEDAGGEVEETETETVEEDVAPDEAPMDAAGGGIPPQVIEALEGLPLPALDALEAEIDRIRAEKGGGDEMGAPDAMDAGGDMGAAPPMPMPGM